MPKFRGVVRIPEERMVGVAAHACRQAWIADVGKSEVSWIRLHRIHKAEDIDAQDMNSFKETLKSQ